jgi:glycosyltransferase involved in cell wall biosynthesis
LGALAQEGVLAHYRKADLFARPAGLPATAFDGLPNVLVEASSQRLPCVSSDLGVFPN